MSCLPGPGGCSKRRVSAARACSTIATGRASFRSRSSFTTDRSGAPWTTSRSERLEMSSRAFVTCDSRPQAALTVDRYEDDWSALAWVQALGRVEVLDARATSPRRSQRWSPSTSPTAEHPPPGPLLSPRCPSASSRWRATELGCPPCASASRCQTSASATRQGRHSAGCRKRRTARLRLGLGGAPRADALRAREPVSVPALRHRDRDDARHAVARPARDAVDDRRGDRARRSSARAYSSCRTAIPSRWRPRSPRSTC